MAEIEADLQEAQLLTTGPLEQISARMQGLPPQERLRRAFLVGANPFVLHPRKLEAIAGRIRQYFPTIESIGCFARVTDVAQKSGEELLALGRLGYDGITIGVETGDDRALSFMNKGYAARDVILQASRLDEARIGYNFFYLAGISGAGRGVEGAVRSAEVFNETRPRLIGSSMLTIFPDSALYREIQQGNWAEEDELEKLAELRALLARLTIETRFVTDGASNLIQVRGSLPGDREKLVRYLTELIETADEAELRRYRVSLRHL